MNYAFEMVMNRPAIRDLATLETSLQTITFFLKIA